MALFRRIGYWNRRMVRRAAESRRPLSQKFGLGACLPVGNASPSVQGKNGAPPGYRVPPFFAMHLTFAKGASTPRRSSGPLRAGTSSRRSNQARGCRLGVGRVWGRSPLGWLLPSPPAGGCCPARPAGLWCFFSPGAGRVSQPRPRSRAKASAPRPFALASAPRPRSGGCGAGRGQNAERVGRFVPGPFVGVLFGCSGCVCRFGPRLGVAAGWLPRCVVLPACPPPPDPTGSRPPYRSI